MKEETLALVHFSLILEEMLEAIKEVHPKQLFFCCSFHTEDEGLLRKSLLFEDCGGKDATPAGQKICNISQKKMKNQILQPC